MENILKKIAVFIVLLILSFVGQCQQKINTDRSIVNQDSSLIKGGNADSQSIPNLTKSDTVEQSLFQARNLAKNINCEQIDNQAGNQIKVFNSGSFIPKDSLSGKKKN